MALTRRELERILKSRKGLKIREVGWHDEITVDGQVYKCRHSELVERLEQLEGNDVSEF